VNRDTTIEHGYSAGTIVNVLRLLADSIFCEQASRPRRIVAVSHLCSLYAWRAIESHRGQIEVNVGRIHLVGFAPEF
jgi:hypothetical protein